MDAFCKADEDIRIVAVKEAPLDERCDGLKDDMIPLWVER